MSRPTSVSELYPKKWLTRDELPAAGATSTVTAVTVEEVFDTIDRKKKMKAVLTLAGFDTRMILNVTQCEAMTAIAGDEHFSAWRGCRVLLQPGHSHNGKETIVIKPAPKAGDYKAGDRVLVLGKQKNKAGIVTAVGPFVTVEVDGLEYDLLRRRLQPLEDEPAQ